VVGFPRFAAGDDFHGFSEGDEVERGVDAAFIAADDGEGIPFERRPITDAGTVDGVFAAGECVLAGMEELTRRPD
jgi:hypothetical protein